MSMRTEISVAVHKHRWNFDVCEKIVNEVMEIIKDRIDFMMEEEA